MPGGTGRRHEYLRAESRPAGRWQWILDHHTNLIIAQNGVAKSQRLLQLAKMTPWIPDINVDASIQHDNTVAPFGTAYNLHAGIPIPLFDRNRGNIMSADAALMLLLKNTTEPATNLRPHWPMPLPATNPNVSFSTITARRFFRIRCRVIVPSTSDTSRTPTP